MSGVTRVWTRRRFLQMLAVAVPVGLPALQALASMTKKPLPAYDLSFLGTGVEVVSRSKWTLANPRTLILKPAEYFDRITVHHSGAVNTHRGVEEVARDMEAILLVHNERDFGDIGYHFVIDASGRIWEGRSLAYEGAHVAGQNENNIGIMLLGNFGEQDLSAAQKTTLAALVERLSQQFQIKSHRLYGHRDLGHSLCPGQKLYDYVHELKGTEEKSRGGTGNNDSDGNNQEAPEQRTGSDGLPGNRDATQGEGP